MNYHNQSDYDLVRQFINGDHSCIDELINRHKSRVFTYILVTVKDRQLADDIFQDTFIKVIKSLKAGNYKEEGRFLSWVLRIAHNLVIDHFRREQNFKTVSSEDNDYDIFNNAELCEKNIEDEIVYEQITTDVKKLVDFLPDDQREVVIMRHYQGLSFKEIAEQTNVSINTALGRMRYALINMRKMIDEKKMVLTSN